MSEKNYSVAAEINTEKNKLFVSFAGTPTFRYVNIDGKVEIEFNEDGHVIGIMITEEGGYGTDGRQRIYGTSS
jgi:hypothetical protein